MIVPVDGIEVEPARNNGAGKDQKSKSGGF